MQNFNLCKPASPGDLSELPKAWQNQTSRWPRVLLCKMASQGGLVFGFHKYKWKVAEWLLCQLVAGEPQKDGREDQPSEREGLKMAVQNSLLLATLNSQSCLLWIQSSSANVLQQGLQNLMLTLRDSAFQRWEL